MMDARSTRSSMSSPGINSTPMSDKDTQLLSAKYTKLASEYSKVRAQLGVLKKAVLEEQAKNVGASENVKQKEQALRKSEAEMDSLTFRNQQLTRRVEILQEDIEKKALEAHGGSSRKKSVGLDTNTSLNSGAGHLKVVSGHLHRDTDRVSASESLNSVMGEELQLKITENAKLHAALDGVDKRYEDRIGSLQSKIKELEVTASKQAQAERADDTRLKELVHGLKVENADLTSNMKKLERELDNKNDHIMMLQVQLESTMTVRSNNNANEKISVDDSSDIPFQDSTVRKLSSNLSLQSGTSTYAMTSSTGLGFSRNPVPPPLTSTEARIQTVELLSQIGENVQEVIAALSDLHTYWEHRIKDTHLDGQAWTENSKQLQKHLLENVRHLKPIEQAYQDILSGLLTSSGKENSLTSLSFPLRFSSFANNLHEYVNYAQITIEPLLLANLSEESSKISCSSTQQAANNNVQLAVSSFNSCLSKLTVQIMALTENQTANGMKSTSLYEQIENLVVSISLLVSTASNMSSVYQSKASDEAELPTVSSALRNTNQCVVAATVSLTSGLEALSRNLTSHLPKIGALVGANFNLVSSDDSLIEKDGKNDNNDYDSSQSCSSDNKCVPEVDSSEMYLSLINDLNEKVLTLKQQSDGLNERLKKTEQEKEHWKVEYQLVQMRHDKLRQKADLESKNEKNDDFQEESHLDLGIIISEDKCVYENRISELVADRLLSDSKATHFYLECVALQKKVKSREKTKLNVEKELQSAQTRISNLHEGMGTTSSNYEQQITMLSEHVANMNEKLAQKTEDIQKLQFEINQKRHKGGSKR